MTTIFIEYIFYNLSINPLSSVLGKDESLIYFPRIQLQAMRKP